MKKGFTLVELIVVMAIIALLATFGVTTISASMRKARDAKRKADIKLIQHALELYKEDYGRYPIPGQLGVNWISSGNGDGWFSELTPKYIKQLPKDPLNSMPSPPGAPDQNPNNHVYAYFTGSYCGLTAGQFYVLATNLEDTQDKDIKATIVNQDGGGTNCYWPSGGLPAGSTIYAVSNP